MKVLVTGGSGFIGNYVLLELISRDIKPIVITRDVSNLERFTGKINTLQLDLATFSDIDLNQLKDLDLLIHLAWGGLPNYKSLYHYENELPKQYRFLKTLISKGVKKIFVTGTCFEYGMQSGAIHANSITIPNNPYGFAKDTLRKQLEFLKAEHDFGLIWGRLFYMYGEGQAKSSLYPQLKQAVLSGDKVFNMSGGEQIRDYLHVAEVAKKIVSYCLDKHSNGCINICSGQPVKVKDLVNEWLKTNGWEVNLNLGFYPYPDYEPMSFWGLAPLDE